MKYTPYNYITSWKFLNSAPPRHLFSSNSLKKIEKYDKFYKFYKYKIIKHLKC